jgi:hypothetical protein
LPGEEEKEKKKKKKKKKEEKVAPAVVLSGDEQIHVTWQRGKKYANYLNIRLDKVANFGQQNNIVNQSNIFKSRCLL